MNFEIVYNNIDNMYHMVEEGDPKGTSFGTGETVEDCLEDAKILLGELKEIGKGIFTDELTDDEFYNYHLKLCNIYEKKFLNCNDDKILYHLSKEFTNKYRGILSRMNEIYLKQIIRDNHRKTLDKGQARMLELHLNK